MAKVSAGRDELGAFAPKFAQLNDDVLFGEVWSREEKLSARDAKNHGVTAEEMAEILTHAAFYAGWPKAWAALRMAKTVYTEGDQNHAR